MRIWDTGRKYSEKHYDFRAWKNRRSEWTQVPYGRAGGYEFAGDCVLEGRSFWISLHASDHDAVFLYAKVAPDGTPSRHNELYRSCDAPIVSDDGVYGWNNVPGRVRCYGGGASENRVLKNTPGEIVVESDAIPRVRGGVEIKTVTRYRVGAGTDWFEVTPVSQADEQGMHGETRFLIVPDGAMQGQDYVVDSWMHQGGVKGRTAHGIWCPDNSRMTLDLAADIDVIWLMSWPDPFKARPYAINCWGGWQSGWQHIGEGDSPRIISSPFARFGGGTEPVVIGVLYRDYWHYQRVGREVTEGQEFTGSWKRAYERELPHGSYTAGSPWRPGYAGLWRIIGCIDGEYHTRQVEIGGEPPSEFSFPCPASGTLEYLLTYLYDRTDRTPEEVSTPMDIYRQTQAHFGNGA